MSYVVLSHPQLDDARIVVHIDAVHEHEARGWEPLGPCSDRSRDPLLTDDEQAELDAEIAAQAAALAPASDENADADENAGDDEQTPADPDPAAASAAAADPQE